MVSLLGDVRRSENDAQSVTSMASTNASLEFEISRLKHQLEKSRKENEHLKEKLFQVMMTSRLSTNTNYFARARVRCLASSNVARSLLCCQDADVTQSVADVDESKLRHSYVRAQRDVVSEKKHKKVESNSIGSSWHSCNHSSLFGMRSTIVFCVDRSCFVGALRLN